MNIKINNLDAASKLEGKENQPDSLKACRNGKDESRDRTNGKVFINIFRTLCLLLGPFFCSNSRVKDFDDSAIKIFILNNIFTSSSKITETSSNAERLL